MRTIHRMDELKRWTFDTICKGKQFKTPAKDGDVREVVRQEPQVFVGYFPTLLDSAGMAYLNAMNVVPSILLMPSVTYAENNEEQRFDRYSNVHSPKKAGHMLSLQALFSIYEDGVRLPGFIDSAEDYDGYDFDKIVDGSREGVGLLFNWMEEFSEQLLGVEYIPNTDMCVIHNSLRYRMISDQHYINDKRPIYYGLVEVDFQCLTSESQSQNKNIRDILL